jgi:hypothetical protein
VTAPTAEEFKRWLLEELRRSVEWRSGVSLTVEALAAAEIPELVVRYVGDGPPPEVESIGFGVQLTAHRMTRDEAEERLRSAQTSIGNALGGAVILPGNAEYEGIGQLTELAEDADRKVFSASFPIYLGVET